MPVKGGSPPADSSLDSAAAGVLRSTLGNYAARFVSLGTWFVLTPIVLRYLGPSEYGLWVLVGSTVAYSGLLDFGVERTLTRFVARFLVQGRLDEARSVIATALWLYCGLGLVAVALAAALASSFGSLFQVPAEERATATRLVMLMGLQIGLSLPCVTGTAVLQSLHRYDLTGMVEAVGTLAYAGLTLIVISQGGGVLGMALANLPVILASQLVSARLVCRVRPGLLIGWRGAQRRHLRQITSFSWGLFALEVSDVWQRKSDEIVIGALLPISAITPYSLARRVADLSRTLVAQFYGVLLPLATELDAADDVGRLRSLYLTSTRLTLMVAIPIGATLCLLAPWVLTVWVGDAYAGNDDLVVILSLAGLCWASQGPATQVFQGMGRHTLPAVVSLLAGLTNLGLSIALAPRLGLVGVAVGTLVPALLELVAFRLPYTLRLLRIRPLELFVHGWLPAVLPVAPMALVLTVLASYVRPALLVPLVGVVAAGLVVYATTYALVSAGDAERRLVSRLLGSVRPSLRFGSR